MTMEYRPIGRSGLRVSAIGLGCNTLGERADEAESIRILETAVDAGITLLDTANIYAKTESERIIGKALKTIGRDRVVLATKAGLATGDGPNDEGASRLHLLRELEGSLRRLQTDYIDLYYVHRFDETTPLEETLLTLDDLVRAGKVRYIACSNYAAWQLAKALWISDRDGLVAFIAIQPPYSLVDRRIEQEIVPLCLDQGIGIIPYLPLAGGLLTGKYRAPDAAPAGTRLAQQQGFRDRIHPRTWQAVEQLRHLADRHGIPLAHLSIAWAMHRPGVSSVLVGARRSDQVRSNAAAAEVRLSPELLEELDRCTRDFTTINGISTIW